MPEAKEEAKEKNTVKDEKEPEQNVLEQMGFTGRGYRVKVYKTGPAVHKGRKVKTGCVAQYEGDALPTLDDIQQECAVEYGGGNYTVRVQAPDNTWVKGGTHSFSIDIDELEPRYIESGTEGETTPISNKSELLINRFGETRPQTHIDTRELLRDRDYDSRFRSLEEKFDRLLTTIASANKGDGTPALVAAINSSTQATLAAMQSSTSANLEAMKLLLSQSQAAKEDMARREEARAKESRDNLQVLLSSLEKSFEAATQSQKAISEAMQANKSEVVEMLKTMIMESKQSGEQMLSTIMSVLLQGIEMGRSSASPESDLQVVAKSITEGIKAVSDVRSKNPVVTEEQIRKVAVDAVNKVKQQEKPAPKAEPQETPADRSMADKVADYIASVLKEKPEKHNIIATVTSLLPLPVNARVKESRDWTVVFDWIRDKGTVEKVNSLGALLMDPDTASWFEKALREEVSGYGAQS
jgi:hypothetical protein